MHNDSNDDDDDDDDDDDNYNNQDLYICSIYHDKITQHALHQTDMTKLISSNRNFANSLIKTSYILVGKSAKFFVRIITTSIKK
jgi:hypothetical protein